MTINTTTSDFFTQLKKKYRNKIIAGKKSTKQVIEYCKENYKILPIYDVDKLDYIGQSKFDQLKNLIDVNEFNRKNKYKFEIYQLEENINTKKFYKYYHNRFEGKLKIYIYHEIKTDKLFSNANY